MELSPIPGGHAAFAPRGKFGHRHVSLAKDHIGAIGPGIEWFGPRDGLRNRCGIGCRALAGAVIGVVGAAATGHRGLWPGGLRAGPSRWRGTRPRPRAGGKNREQPHEQPGSGPARNRIDPAAAQRATRIVQPHHFWDFRSCPIRYSTT
jgi:hypothetical protein